MLIQIFEEAVMPKFPPLASPVAKDRREYYRAARDWFQKGTGAFVEKPADPLQRYLDAHPSRRKKLISIRVDEELLELTREVARQHNLRYQAVIRIWIQEGLRRSIREGPEDPEPSPVV
jgi:uncharacterized protein (DUF4415 family)